MCNCQLCQEGRKLRSLCDKLPPEDSAWLKSYADRQLSIAMEADYYSAIFSGDWPDAVEILKRALARVAETPCK